MFQKAWGGGIDLKKTHDVKSTYFEVLGRLRMPQTTLQDLSVLQREGPTVNVLWRDFGIH
jgi:general secretion pathway protein K